MASPTSFLQPPRRRTQHQPATDVEMDEPEVAALSQAQRDRLTRAFDQAGRPKPASSRGPSARKKRRTDVVESPPEQADEEGGGGFMVDDDDGGGGSLLLEDGQDDLGGGFLPDDDDAGGGFLAEDEEAAGGSFAGGSHEEEGDFLPDPTSLTTNPPTDLDPNSTRIHLPLSLVSEALKIVGLPPSDPEVLEFFRQSAEGWAGEVAEVGDEEQRGGVSRKDWMSVCAVLLASRGEVEVEEEEEEEEEESDVEGWNGSSDLSEPDDGDPGYTEDGGIDPEGDLHNPSRRRTRRATRASSNLSPLPSLPSDDESEDDKPSTSRKPAKGKSKRPTKKSRLLNDDDEPPTLLKAEKRAAREAFALFLPDDGSHSVDGRVLSVGVLRNVVRDLKEGWSDKQVSEMVEAFSNLPGKKALTLQDFERLMWEGNLFRLLSD